MVRVLLLSLLLLSCSPRRPEPGIDADFIPLLSAFLQDAQERGIDLTEQRRRLYAIRYGTIEENSLPGAIGICYQQRWRYWIVIDPTDRGTTARRTLLYHELGHCLLEALHVPEEEDPFNIMNPSIPLVQEQDTDGWNELVNKLFREGVRE